MENFNKYGIFDFLFLKLQKVKSNFENLKLVEQDVIFPVIFYE